MRWYVVVPILAASFLISYAAWVNSPEYIKKGGPLLILGGMCFLLTFTVTLERLVVLWRAGGRGDVASFVRNVKKAVDTGNMQAAIDACKKQGGCLANVVGAGLERYHVLKGSTLEKKELMEETRRAIEEANALESPLLERNLIALSTIASIATMLGLLGTTIGMIRSFNAMSHAGAPDASQLPLGISEALVNTALGLTTAIIGITLYNYFMNRVDTFNYAMDETTYEVLQLLQHRKEG